MAEEPLHVLALAPQLDGVGYGEPLAAAALAGDGASVRAESHGLLLDEWYGRTAGRVVAGSGNVGAPDRSKYLLLSQHTAARHVERLWIRAGEGTRGYLFPLGGTLGPPLGTPSGRARTRCELGVS